MKKKILCLLLIVFAIFVFLQGTMAYAATQIKLGFVTSSSSTWAEGGRKFKELVENQTDKININLFPNAQLAAGSTVKEIEMIRNGSIEMGILGGIESSSFVPEVGIFTMPFMFPSYDVAVACENGPFGKHIEKLYEKQNILVLAWGANDFRDFTNNVREIKNPADLKGIKMRVPNSEMYIDLWRIMGANPVCMSWSEAVGALKTGTIDGQENGPQNTWSAKAYELIEYFTVSNYSYDPIMLVINKNFWRSLSAEEQNILRVAAINAMDYQWKFVRDTSQEILGKIEQEGVKITELNNEERKAFQKKVEPFFEKWNSKLGEELVNSLKAEIENYSKD